MGKKQAYGENYYRVKEMAGLYTDISMSRILSITRERVRQLRIKSSYDNLLAPRKCTRCDGLFAPKHKLKSTCGCKVYSNGKKT